MEKRGKRGAMWQQWEAGEAEVLMLDTSTAWKAVQLRCFGKPVGMGKPGIIIIFISRCATSDD